MSEVFLLRVLVCDPEKATSRRLLDCLTINPNVEESTSTATLDNLMELLVAGNINLLFIDPIALELLAASRLIFEIREKLPHVLVCLYKKSSEVRQHMTEFYAGERQRFEHYFTLDKELAGAAFGEDVYQILPHCLEAARRMSKRPVRIQLMSLRPTIEHGSRESRNPQTRSQPVAKKTSPAKGKKRKLVKNFLLSLPGAGTLGGNGPQP